MKVLSDEELIRSVAEGEGDAFRLLYERHQGRVRGYLARRLRTVEEAEEAAQDVFLKLDRGARTFNGAAAFGPWLMAITRNVLRDRFRQVRDRREVALPAQGIEAYQPRPQDGELRDLIRALPTHYRTALTLKYFAGLSYREAAAELGITEKGLETRLLRAKTLLRQAILRRRNMTCRDRQGALLRLADDELPPSTSRELRGHLAGCEDCRSTLDLLRAENDAIASALSPTEARASTPHFRRAVAAAAALLLLVGGILGLLHLYEQIDAAADRDAARSQAQLDVRVVLWAEEVPLGAFLREVSSRSGVSVTLSPAARGQFAVEPSVNIMLSQPIMLRSLLTLLSDFYELAPETRNGRVVLY